MTRSLLIVSLLMASQAGAEPPVRYDGHRLVRVTVESLRELRTALALTDDVFTCGGVGIGTWEARFGPAQFEALRQSGIAHRVITENLQAGIDAERARLQAGNPEGPWFSDFKNLSAISAYVDTLAALRPEVATRISLGQSLEGREIFGLRITNDQANPGRCKPALLFNATQHAREWIAPMVTMYAADRLVRGYGTDPVATDLVDRAEILFVPVVNPDGYVWSWTMDRYWRKNRRANAGGSFGVDTNRNWGFQWGGVGASTSPSSQTYRGTGPFSEPETQVMRDFVNGRPGLRAHVDVHSYGQLLLYPWCYTPTPSPGHATFGLIAQQMRALILAVHGRAYTPGIWYTALYPSSGTATDFVYGGAGANSYTFELRGPDFVVAPTEILPNAEEIYPALVYFGQWTVAEYPFRADFNGDCVYNLADFGSFQTAFAQGDPRADFNGDGVLNLADFGAFQSAFALGR